LFLGKWENFYQNLGELPWDKGLTWPSSQRVCAVIITAVRVAMGFYCASSVAVMLSCCMIKTMRFSVSKAMGRRCQGPVEGRLGGGEVGLGI
jgi:hypothetical protein